MEEALSVRLVILGLLHVEPMHGYEIKALIEERMGDWTSIAFGSIYHALGRLESEGVIEQVAVEQKGARPARNVYAITEAGRTAFTELLRGLWSGVERTYYAIDLGVFFMSHVPRGEVRNLVRSRVAVLEEQLRHVDAHEVDQQSRFRFGARARAIFDHTRRHLEVELEWTRDLLAQVEGGADLFETGVRSRP